MRSNHRSQEFSNLCNWKLKAWKKFRLQRDSNPWPPRYRCDALPTELWSHTLGAKSIGTHNWPPRYRCDALQTEANWAMKSHIGSKVNWNPQLTLLPMCGFIAQLVEHRTGKTEVTGSNPVEAWIFFRFLISNCINWKIHCDDHFPLSSTSVVHIWIIFIYFTLSTFWLTGYVPRMPKGVFSVVLFVS